MTRIVIDADGCPKGAKAACIEASKKYNCELIMFIDDAHELKGEFTVIKVPKGRDAVDHEMVIFVKEGDIIVTQDYGLAEMVLDKAKAVLNPAGFKYTKFNIESLLFSRHMGQKARNSGKRTKGPKKRKTSQDVEFKKILFEVFDYM